MRLLAFILSLYLALTPTLIHAEVAPGSSIGGWQWVSTARDGITSIYTASKKTVVDGATIVRTSTARITPTAAQVGRYAVRGAAGIAIALFEVTILDGIDWVMSPDGGLSYNQVPPEELAPYDFTALPSWAEAGYFFDDTFYPSIGGAAAAWCAESNGSSELYIFSCSGSGDSISYSIKTIFGDPVPGGTHTPTKVVNPNFVDSAPKPQRKPIVIPSNEVGDRIIDLAKPDAPVKAIPLAQQIINDTADSAWDKSKPAAGVPPSQVEGELSNNGSLDNSGTATGTGTGSTAAEGTGTATGSGTEGSFELPQFCNWVPILCEASVSAINFFEFMTTFFAYDEELYDKLGTVDASQSASDQSRLSGDLNNFRSSLGLSSSACPASFTVSIPKITSVDIDLSYWCTLMAIVKLLLHLGVCFVAFRIISNSVQEF
jgi:hypothetical protein